MSKEEVIKQIESFQLDISDDKKIYILQFHFPNNTSREVTQKTMMSIYDAMEIRYERFPKNIFLFPATDDIYIEKLEVSKEDKLK